WTSEKLWTSSSAAAAGRIASGSAPAASPVARQSTGRIRLPPPSSAYRIDSVNPPSSGVSARSPRYDSISSRSSSGLCILGLPLRLLDLGLHGAREVGELLEQLDRRLVLRLEAPA